MCLGQAKRLSALHDLQHCHVRDGTSEAVDKRIIDAHADLAIRVSMQLRKKKREACDHGNAHLGENLYGLRLMGEAGLPIISWSIGTTMKHTAGTAHVAPPALALLPRVSFGSGGGGGVAWLDTRRELGCRSRGAVRSIVHREHLQHRCRSCVIQEPS
jgi:hypothetical protein